MIPILNGRHYGIIEYNLVDIISLSLATGLVNSVFIPNYLNLFLVGKTYTDFFLNDTSLD